MNKKSRTVEFIGTPSGDGESFCWDVDEENFKKVVGREIEEDFDYFLGALRLYPDNIFGDEYIYNENNDVIGINKLGKCKIKISYEEIESQ